METIAHIKTIIVNGEKHILHSQRSEEEFSVYPGDDFMEIVLPEGKTFKDLKDSEELTVYTHDAYKELPIILGIDLINDTLNKEHILSVLTAEEGDDLYSTLQKLYKACGLN